MPSSRSLGPSLWVQQEQFGSLACLGARSAGSPGLQCSWGSPRPHGLPPLPLPPTPCGSVSPLRCPVGFPETRTKHSLGLAPPPFCGAPGWEWVVSLPVIPQWSPACWLRALALVPHPDGPLAAALGAGALPFLLLECTEAAVFLGGGPYPLAPCSPSAGPGPALLVPWEHPPLKPARAVPGLRSPRQCGRPLPLCGIQSVQREEEGGLGGARSPTEPLPPIQVSCPVAHAPRGLHKVEMCAPARHPRVPVALDPALSQLPGWARVPVIVPASSCTCPPL